MQNNPYPPQQPTDPSGQPYPPGQPMYPGQPYPPAQQQPYYPPPQPYYPPPPPPQQFNPNQIAIVVNNSQKVNSGGCAPWVIWLTVGIVSFFLLVLVGIPVVGVLMASTTIQKAASPPMGSKAVKDSPHHKVSETVNVTNMDEAYTLQVSATQIKKDTDTDKTYLVVNLVANNTGDTSTFLNSAQFSLVDASNNVIKADSFISDIILPDMGLFNGNAEPGDKLSGVLAFEIQPGQTKFTMTYQVDDLATGKKSTYDWDLQV